MMMKRLLISFLCILFGLIIIIIEFPKNVVAEDSYVNIPDLSIISIDPIFGMYQKNVDENIYYSLSYINDSSLIRIYGDHSTPMFEMTKETINPCMALATTWGEAGCSYPGISMTTIMDFQPSTYSSEIDWVKVTANLQEVDSAWYLANAVNNVNVCEGGKAYGMPNALLQHPSGKDRSESTMIDLGVGSYQITSSDWDKWNLDNRVNPVYGFSDSLKKCGSAWIDCGINPISDFTVYACLSLGHQGGSLINYEFGKQLINLLNKPNVQNAFYKAANQLYEDVYNKALEGPTALNGINLNPYLNMVETDTGIDFSDYTGGVGRTNKGNYVALHCIRYCFYKYYFTGGV